MCCGEYSVNGLPMDGIERTFCSKDTGAKEGDVELLGHGEWYVWVLYETLTAETSTQAIYSGRPHNMNPVDSSQLNLATTP